MVTMFGTRFPVLTLRPNHEANRYTPEPTLGPILGLNFGTKLCLLFLLPNFGTEPWDPTSLPNLESLPRGQTFQISFGTQYW